MRYKIVYDSPGRLRVRSGADAFSKLRETGICNVFLRIPGVRSVKATSANGGILIEYDGNIRDVLLDTVKELDISSVPEAALTQKQLTDIEFKRDFKKIIGRRILMKLFLPSFLAMPVTVIKAMPFVKEGLKSLMNGKINVSVLDAVSITASIAGGSPSTAASVMTLLNISSLLEGYTRQKAKTALSDSLSLNIDKVWKVTDGTAHKIPLKQLEVGDIVRVQQGSMIPVDGSVVNGEAGVNEAAMTGEAMPAHKQSGSTVYAGTVIEDGSIDIEVTQLPDSSRISRIADLIESSESLKSGVQTKAENFADSLVPLSLLTCAATYLFTGNVTKALSVLMVDYSCAIKLSTPICIISAMREATEYEIMVKGGRFLENYAHADTMVFDKTGTLTVSCPNLARVIAFESYTEDEVLKTAACLEEHFPHSVAKAIVHAAEERNLEHKEEHAEVEYIVAHGISTRLHGERALIGSSHFIFDDENISVTDEQRETILKLGEEYSMVYLAIGEKLCGILCIEDPIRENAAQVIKQLKEKGFSDIMMITGDGESTAKSVCAKLGIDSYRARVLPEDKLNIINEIQSENHMAVMVGDGINDSPALAAAGVSVAMKDASDIAREVADVTLLSSDLDRLCVLRDLSEKLFRRIRRNYLFISAFNSGLILLGIGGIITPVTSALLHNVSTLGICAWSMRPFLEKEKITGNTLQTAENIADCIIKEDLSEPIIG